MGTTRFDGYVFIRVDGVVYPAHRLAWLWMTGVWPQEEIDHANGNPSDNSWENLREATHGENQQNGQRVYRSNFRSGICGVYYKNRGKKRWEAILWKDKKAIYLGRFATKEEAGIARREGELLYHGEFAGNR